MNNNRQNIIDATERLLRTHGLARLTTREIAREAKVAEGLIYHHFKDKAELIFEVIQALLDEPVHLMENLPLRVGTRTLLENLEDVLNSVYRAHYEISPIICSVFADQRLLSRTQEIIKEREMGPQRRIEGLSVYLTAEQRMGRLAITVDPQMIARCLWLIIMQSAMLDQLVGNKTDTKHIHQEIHDYVKTMLTGIEPQQEIKEKNEAKKNK
jgi:AcrR family transcriptional regulator